MKVYFLSSGPGSLPSTSHNSSIKIFRGDINALFSPTRILDWDLQQSMESHGESEQQLGLESLGRSMQSCSQFFSPRGWEVWVWTQAAEARLALTCRHCSSHIPVLYIERGVCFWNQSVLSWKERKEGLCVIMEAEVFIAGRRVKFWFSNAEVKELYFCSFFSFHQKKQLFYFVHASLGALKLLLWRLFFPINSILCFVASKCFKTLWLIERRYPVPSTCRHPIKPHFLVLAESSCLDSGHGSPGGSMPRIFYPSQEHSCSPGSLRDTTPNKRDHFLSTK